MNLMKNLLCFIISSLFLLKPCLYSYAQEHSPDAKDGYLNELYKSVVNEYGFDQVLVNGITETERKNLEGNKPALIEVANAFFR